MKKMIHGSLMVENDKLEALVECLQAFKEKSFYSTITMITEEKIRKEMKLL